MGVSIFPLGDHALTIALGQSIDVEIHQQVVSLREWLLNENINGVKDIIPAYASLTIVYDVLQIKGVAEGSAYSYMEALAKKALEEVRRSSTGPAKRLHIPVCYHPSLGLDLGEMSEQKQLATEEIIRLHTSVIYKVYMLGFLPGFAYMATVDKKIATPRKATPRKRIAAGSVGIADAQTGIYPFDSPGGWNIIGQTPEPLFYPQLQEPCLFSPGDEVQFMSITLDEYLELKN